MPRAARYDSSTASSSSSTSDSSDSDDEKRILPTTRSSRTRRRKEKERENVQDDSSGSEDDRADLKGKPRKYRGASCRRAKVAKARRRRKKTGNDNVHSVLVCLAILAVALLLVASGYYVWKNRELLFGSNTTPDGSNQSGFIGSNPDPSPTFASLPVPAIPTTSTIFSSNSPAPMIAPPNPLPFSNTSVSTNTTGTAKNCFPFGGAQLPSTGLPTVPQSSWWCPPSEMYGFLGFSYPMEVSDCADRTNGFDAISKDFAKMKTFGATLVRVYAPQCGKVSVWENLVKAGVANNMGIIVQVWWGFGQPPDELFQQTRTAIYSLFTTSSYAAIAKYVVQSAAFGSEPIGDGVDGNQFATGEYSSPNLNFIMKQNLIRSFHSDLTAFKTKMNSFGIPVAISEDWDRPESMSTSSGALGSIGQQIAANTDLVQAHIMPYYHGVGIGNAWSYTQKQVSWLRKTVNKPLIFLTECPWSSQSGGSHDTDKSAETLPNFKTYWNSFADNCVFFKSQQVGWFLHTFNDGQEPYFGLINGQGESKIPNFLPVRC